MDLSRKRFSAPTLEEIADMASRGEDIAAYFTNRFVVVRSGKPALKTKSPGPKKNSRRGKREPGR
jgi:hypothetical protein